MEPTDSADPTLPIERMDPFDATERTEFSEANDHREEVGGFILATLTPVPRTASDDNALFERGRCPALHCRRDSSRDFAPCAR